MFTKILIANRGEIACRIIKTARRMRIATVAVYSDADCDALHVEMADEAVHIGAPPAAESYLDGGKIIDACRQTGAEAVHPGYGFLSERASFCEALEAAGVAFIGPKPKAINAMGDKIEAKKFANAAKVSTVPGYLGVITDAAHAETIASQIGYPVIIKASAGGGGKGMRIAWTKADIHDGFERASSEAKKAFGDERLFIEKYIVDPRHIEIQVLGDSHGKVLHLGERECSIQRRNQKVVEEAPSPFLDDSMRKAMGQQSVALAKAVDYQSAGTVEFIVDSQGNFYFLEMNTRLQVEHPVTELITGIDIVEQMIRIAAGEPLSFTQEDVSSTGWAIESRVYAEDPYRNFLPSIGRLTRYRPPPEGQTGSAILRNDTGVFEGAEISRFYDPMIAKLCSWAPTRLEAIEAMGEALDGFVIDGIENNIPFLSALMKHPRWREGRLSTAFIDEEYPDGFALMLPDPTQTTTFVAVCLACSLIDADRRQHYADRLRPPATHAEHWTVKLDKGYHPVRLRQCTVGAVFDGVAEFAGGDIEIVTDWRPGDAVWRGTVGRCRVTAQVRLQPDGLRLDWQGLSARARLLTPRQAELDRLMPVKLPPDTSNLLLCPMPGLVVSIAVTEGQRVKAGETLAVVEAMKMENVLRADRDLTVGPIAAKPGDSLAVDAVIMGLD